MKNKITATSYVTCWDLLSLPKKKTIIDKASCEIDGLMQYAIVDSSKVENALFRPPNKNCLSFSNCSFIEHLEPQTISSIELAQDILLPRLIRIGDHKCKNTTKSSTVFENLVNVSNGLHELWNLKLDSYYQLTEWHHELIQNQPPNESTTYQSPKPRNQDSQSTSFQCDDDQNNSY